MIDNILEKLKKGITITGSNGYSVVITFDQKEFNATKVNDYEFGEDNYLPLEWVETRMGTVTVLGKSSDGAIMFMYNNGQIIGWDKSIHNRRKLDHQCPDIITEQIMKEFGLLPIAVLNQLSIQFRKKRLYTDLFIAEETKKYWAKIAAQKNNNNNNNTPISKKVVAFSLPSGQEQFLLYQKNPNNYEALYSAAELGYEPAIKELEKISDTYLNGKHACVLGKIYFTKGNYDLAKKWLIHALEKCNYNEAKYYLALTLMETKDMSYSSTPTTLLVTFAIETSNRQLFDRTISVFDEYKNSEIRIEIQKAYIYATASHFFNYRDAGNLIENIFSKENLNEKEIEKTIWIFNKVQPHYTFSEQFLTNLFLHAKNTANIEKQIDFTFIWEVLKHPNSTLEKFILLIPKCRQELHFRDRTCALAIKLLTKYSNAIHQNELCIIVADLILCYDDPKNILGWLETKRDLITKMLGNDFILGTLKDNKPWQKFIKNNEAFLLNYSFLESYKYSFGFGKSYEGIIGAFKQLQVTQEEAQSEPTNLNNNNTENSSEFTHSMG